MESFFGRLTFIVIPLWIGLLIAVADLAGSAYVDTLQKVDLYFPSPTLEGNDLTMNCRFKVDQNSTIYQVKWYKGSREIFRYQPKQFPPKQPFPFQETKMVIDENQSDMNKLVLRKVPMALKGNVSCEVTWEPSFITITETKHLVVVSPPEQRPIMDVKVTSSPVNGRPRDGINSAILNLGDYFTANCTSGPSIPAPNLTYEINGIDYKQHRHITMKPNEIYDPRNKTEIRTASISLKLDHSHFVDKKIRVKCRSTIFNLYNETSSEFIGELPRERIQPAGYGGFGKNGDTRSRPGKLVWSITTIGVGKLVLVLLKFSL